VSKLFSDPEYHKMSTDEESWLELAIEPFRFYLNDMVYLLPERIELDFKEVYNLIKHNTDDWHLSIEPDRILRPLIERAANKSIGNGEMEILLGLYSIDIVAETEIDFVRKEMSHPIVISRTGHEIPEDKLAEVISDLAMRSLEFNEPRPGSPGHSEIVSRMNEIFDLIGFEDNARSTRSIRRKSSAIKARVGKIILEDEWRIRNYEIIENFCKHLNSFINSGNMHALMNITRLKCMTHKGLPIYSMEDIK